MKQVVHDFSNYVKTLKTLKKNRLAEAQLRYLVPLLRSLKIMIEQKGSGLGKVHYTRRYKDFLKCIWEKIILQGHCFWTEIISSPNDIPLDINKVVIPIPEEDVFPLTWTCLTIGDIVEKVKQEIRNAETRKKEQRKDYNCLLEDFIKSLSPLQISILEKMDKNPQKQVFSTRTLLCQ